MVITKKLNDKMLVLLKGYIFLLDEGRNESAYLICIAELWQFGIKPKFKLGTDFTTSIYSSTQIKFILNIISIFRRLVVRNVDATFKHIYLCVQCKNMEAKYLLMFFM